jgi:hypothetical protein
MKDPIKITQEETQETSDLQQRVQQSVLDFGNLYVEKMAVEGSIKALTEKENKLQEVWKDLQTKETELIQGFYKRYGDGSLDIRRGLFIPNETTK